MSSERADSAAANVVEVPKASTAPWERFLPEKIVKERTSLDRVTRWRMVRNGSFPAPVPISPGRVAWPESAINRWIAERIAAAA